MWVDLPIEQKQKYKKLITGFASLTEAFTQKSFGDSNVKPFVNSKFQETAFQYAFNAVEEDIANTSFDASIATETGDKYLVGLKSFIFSSGDQKVAQFKSSSKEWHPLYNKLHDNYEYLRKNRKDMTNKALLKKLNEMNHDSYLEIAKQVSYLRNERIESSKAQLRGFENEGNIVSVYHVLMPDVTEDHKPLIHVGETSYTMIDIDHIKILGCSGFKNYNIFKFTDGIHDYKYSASDSQLFMTFNNKEIIVDTWDVTYLENTMEFFLNIDSLANPDDRNAGYFVSPSREETKESYSWMLINKDGKVETRSGINSFNAQRKDSRSKRQKLIDDLIEKYQDQLSEKDKTKLSSDLVEILLPLQNNQAFIDRGNALKEELKKFGNEHIFLQNDLLALIYNRPHDEVYIPLPNSKTFHKDHPDFFGEGLGLNLLDNKGKFLKDKEERKFSMRFLPSGSEMEGYIDQENGKAIQSFKKQTILGKWIRQNVFQLKDLELLTTEKLEELGINAIRMTKNSKRNTVDFTFIWIDPENPPKDAIGWVAKSKKKDKK